LPAIVAGPEKVTKDVLPAQAGIYNDLTILDSRLRGKDKTRTISIFYETFIVGLDA